MEKQKNILSFIKPMIYGYFSSPQEFLLFSVPVAIFLILVIRQLVQSPYGRVLTTIRANPSVAESIGKNVGFVRLRVFATTAFMAGIAGGLFCSYVTVAAHTQFLVEFSTFILVMVVLGGSGRWMGSILGVLGYILISAINARASFNLETNEYSYFENINKIFPHSYDARGTWFVFWQYLGLVILFWGTRDWLAGAPISRISISLNPRLKRLFFVICLNGGVLSIVCIVQRFYYGDFLGKLLFLIEPSINNPNNSQFGPFAYRSNAASYLNLIWPISLGLFMQLGQQNLDYGKKRFGNGAELILIPCIILTACGPIISSARGGMFVMIGLIILASISMLALKISSKFLRLSTLISLSAGVIVAYYLGWEKIEPRLMTIFMDKMSYRTENYWSTLEMIKDYGVFGSGPGSFEAIAQFELNDKVTVWQSWVHNDYLEFYLTFGKPGSAIIVILILTLTTQFLTTLLDRGTRALKWFLLLSLIGVFIHAVADFPLQVLSILIPICIITSVLSNTNLNNLRNVYWH